MSMSTKVFKCYEYIINHFCPRGGSRTSTPTHPVEKDGEATCTIYMPSGQIVGTEPSSATAIKLLNYSTLTKYFHIPRLSLCVSLHLRKRSCKQRKNKKYTKHR